MSKSLKLSHSATRMYSQCSRKYQLHYQKRFRSKLTSGALLFGSSMDHALNDLLEHRNLDQALKLFDKSFRFNFINKVGTYLPETTLVTYAKSDFDTDLLTEEDIKKFNEKQYEWNVYLSKSIGEVVSVLQAKKAESGFNSLSEEEKKALNLANWLCLNRKGQIMIKSYYEKALPKIKNVLAIQKQVEVGNQEGDKLIGYIDLIVETQDGKRYVMDNKTSSIEYEANSAQRSQQLILYYHITKQEYKLDGAGFIVMMKHILKNKVKTCSKCQYDGSGGRHKTCANEIDGKRCGGEWIEVINPEARIEWITNEVPEAAENLVMETFDEANWGIKNNIFGPNLGACFNGPIVCEFAKYCWEGSKEDLVELHD